VRIVKIRQKIKGWRCLCTTLTSIEDSKIRAEFWRELSHESEPVFEIRLSLLKRRQF
jgi:hypothetical protein